MKYLTTIPFSGFYCSLHDDELDETLDRMFSDRDTGCRVNYNLAARAAAAMKWRNVHEDYAKEYVDDFGRAMRLDLEFESLDSPRDYAFETDRIFCHITDDSLRKALKETPRETLAEVARKRHTSRSGFVSFYDPNIDNWPADVTEWDPNQIGTLMCAVAEDHTSSGWDQYEEYYLMEDTRGNGIVESILWEHCPVMPRLTKVHEYLEARAKRVELAHA